MGMPDVLQFGTWQNTGGKPPPPFVAWRKVTLYTVHACKVWSISTSANPEGLGSKIVGQRHSHSTWSNCSESGMGLGYASHFTICQTPYRSNFGLCPPHTHCVHIDMPSKGGKILYIPVSLVRGGGGRTLSLLSHHSWGGVISLSLHLLCRWGGGGVHGRVGRSLSTSTNPEGLGSKIVVQTNTFTFNTVKLS